MTGLSTTVSRSTMLLAVDAIAVTDEGLEGNGGGVFFWGENTANSTEH